MTAARLVCLLLAVGACSGPLDAKKLRGELGATASCASEAALLAELAERHDIPVRFYAEHRQQLERKLRESAGKLARGASPPHGVRARHAVEVARQLADEVRALRPDDHAARQRLEQGKSDLDGLEEQIEP
jgi:hypothetical protein